MIPYPTIKDIANFVKEAGINANEFFLATELLIKGQKVKVRGIINISGLNLLVENGINISKQKRYKSYGPGTRIVSIL